MSLTTWRRMLWISTAVAVSSLYAIDGVVLIEPGRVARGNITPGDAPGFPITISQPGSYKLTGNLTVPDSTTTGIEITADNVILDLNGFSIIGPNTCTPNPTRCIFSGGGVGIHAGSFSPGIVAPAGVKVRNGTVRGMGFHGVRLMGDGTAVEQVYTANNGGPGIVVGNGTVADSAATLNGGSGLMGTIVRRSIATQNGSVGIFVRSGGVATGNSAISNGGSGMSFGMVTATSNTVVTNGGFGIDATCPSSIVGNTASGNVSGAIRASGACVLANNAQ